jgi:hypothetical protein
MADVDIQNLNASLQQLGASLRSNAGSVGQSMARLRTEIQRGTGTVQSNAAALQRLISDFENLDEAARKSTMGQKMLADQTAMASQIMRNSVGEMSAGLVKGGLGEAFDYVTKQLYTSIANYQEGTTGMQSAFNNQNAAIESQIKILERLQSGATLTAEALMLIPHPMARFGALVAAGVGGMASLFGKGMEQQKQAFQVFQKEMTITSQSFDVMQKSGVLFQSGFSDVRATAGALQLNMDELSRTVAQNKKELSDFGGSVTGGVRKLKQVGDAFTRLASQGRDLRKDLEYAGYSQQEQTEGMIDYMEMLNRSGRLRSMTDEQIATEGTEYLKVQKAITAYAGADAKARQRAAQEAGEQLAVQAKLRKSQDPKAMEKFQTLAGMMPAEMTKALSQMVATGGSVIDKDLNILFAQSPTRKRMMDEAYADLNSGLFTQAELVERQEQRMKKYGSALEKEALAMGDGIGLATQITGQYAAVTGMAQTQVKEGQKGQASLVDEVGTTITQMKKLTEQGVDPLRDASIEASRAMREDIPKTIRIMGDLINQYNQKTFGEEGLMGMAKAVRVANAQSIAIMEQVLGKVVASGAGRPPMTPGTKVSEAITDFMTEAAKKLVSASQNLSTVTEKLAKILPKAKGGIVSAGPEGGQLALLAEAGLSEAVVPLPDGKSIPVSLNLTNVADMLKKSDTPSPSTNTDDLNKIIDTLTSSLTGLSTQISTGNQNTDAKLSELVNTMRDKTILEDMLRYTEQTADNTKTMANALA